MTTKAKIVGQAPTAMLVVLVAALVLGTIGCANTNNRDEDTRGASLLILDKLTASAGTVDGNAGTESDVLFSDVLTCNEQDPPVCVIAPDTGFGSFRNELLNPAGEGSFYQDINLYRYRVTYTRSDGRNTEGIDVPYHFDSVMSGTVPVGNAKHAFLIVRHVAKVERPLVDLLGIGDEDVISTNTRVDFWGRDIAGNEHHVYGWIDIEFGDYGP